MQDQETKLKLAFASELLKNPQEPFKAGLAVFGTDTGRALRAAAEWLHDETVKQECERLKGEGFSLYDKQEVKEKLITSMFKIVDEERYSPDDRIKAAKLIGELTGNIEKATTVVNNNNVTSNKVMVVRDHGSDEQWQGRVLEQQRALVNASCH